jgi:hypothetical protein
VLARLGDEMSSSQITDCVSALNWRTRTSDTIEKVYLSSGIVLTSRAFIWD